MKKIIKFILTKISRVIFWIIPKEFRPLPQSESLIEKKLKEDLSNETFNHFKEQFKQSILFKIKKNKEGFLIISKIYENTLSKMLC